MKRFIKNNFKLLILIAVIFVTLIALIVFGMIKKNQSTRNQGPTIGQATENQTMNEGDKESKNSLPTCGDKKDFFSVLPIKSTDFGALIPLGNLNPTGHVFPTDHIYLFTKNPTQDGQTSPANAKPVYSPGSVFITTISSSENMSTGKADYAVELQPCEELKVKFGHMGSVTENLKKTAKETGENKCDEYETGGSKFRNCSYFGLKISVTPGEELGTAFDGQSGGFDIWTTDYRQEKLKFANPAKWRTDSFYNACPANYYIEALKNELMLRFGDFNENKRTIEPICGTIEVDVLGTAKGHWFAPGQDQNTQEDKNLALVNSNTNPLKQAFSMGNSGESKGFKSGVYFFLPKSTGNVNLDFALTKPGNTYCYDTDDNASNEGKPNKRDVIFLSLPDEKTIRIERSALASCGSGPWTLTNFVEFSR